MVNSSVKFLYKVIRNCGFGDFGLPGGVGTKPLFVNFLGLTFRKFTSQRTRLYLQEIGKIKKIPYFSKIHGIDYVNYILLNKPIIPYNLFLKADYEEMNYFLKMMILSAFVEGFDKKDFEGRWEKFEKVRKEVGNSLKLDLLTNTFNLYEFKSVVYPDTGVFPDNLNLDVFKNKGHRVCFDLGAFIGDSAFVISKKFTKSKVFAFEPDPANISFLRKNISLNGLEGRIYPVEAGVGLKDGMFELVVGGEGSRIVGIKTKEMKNTVKVKVASIDNFVKKNKIDKVDFIKMDIEGAEFDALRGAVVTLKRDKPDLLVAIYHKGEHFFEIPSWLKKQVPEYNFRFVAMNGASPIIERYIAASVRKI